MAEGYRTFGSYILFQKYTSDALGHLYRAGEFDSSGVKRTVFLRIFDGPHLPIADLTAAFADGQRVAEVLIAANVPTGATFFTHRGVPAMACDYKPAQPLGLVLSKTDIEGFPVPVDNALLVLEKLSLALSAALAVDIGGSPLVHGFLHPALILITTDGEALLTGFGFADRLLAVLDHARVAEAVQPYLAPEVLVSRVPDKRADVYSLGAILVELLSGQPLPADPMQRIDVLDRIQLAYEERVIPDDIRGLLARAIAARPEERFSSAADFKKELDRLLYGGVYSPTTFNLALFMDRLFRSEIEAEEQERVEEESLDISPYLAPEPLPEPELAEPEPPSDRPRRAPWISGGIVAAAIAAAAIIGISTIELPPSGPERPPTPTAEELEAERQQQNRQLEELVQQMVQEKMAEREKEIREELLARQTRIDELQRQLRESERHAKDRQLSQEEEKQRIALEQEIAAEEEAQRRREADLEAERQRLLAQEPTATPTAEKPTQTPVAAAVVTKKPTPEPPTATATAVIIENTFFEPSEVDTMPVVLKEEPVAWPRQALHSRRQGLVIVQATVNSSGRVEDVKVLRADHEGFGIPQAVVEAVRRYRFKPATKNGVAIKSHATVARRYRFANR
jgi:serine/threonine-protein kinase